MALSGVLVLLTPSAEASSHYRVTNTDVDGGFKMQDVPPGEYTIFAWESILPIAWMNSKGFERYERRGRPISLTSGVSLGLQLPLIPESN